MIINLTLDINKSEGRFSSIERAITLRQTDAVAYAINASIQENGSILNLSDSTVRFYATKPDGSTLIEEATVTSPEDGVVFYTLPPNLTEFVGSVNAYFRVTAHGGYSASTSNISFKIKQGAFLEATGGDYAPDIDKVLAALEEQRVNHANAEDVRTIEWNHLVEDVHNATGRANSAVDKCNAFLNTFTVEYDDLSADAKEKIAASAASGLEIATSAEIETAYERDIAPVLGSVSALEELTQEEFDWALVRIFG